MKKLTFTKKETIRLHRKMWHWLAKNPEKHKRDWPGWKNIKENVINYCFACQYAMDKAEKNKITCYFCPFLWERATICQASISPYSKWLYTHKTRRKLRSKYAFRIATLKIRRFSK